MKVEAEVFDKRHVVVEDGEVQRVYHVDVHAVTKDALLPENIDFRFANLFAQYLLANLGQLAELQPSRKVVHVVFQDNVVDLVVPPRLEQLAQLRHPSRAAVGQNLEANKFVINVVVLLFGLLHQQFH